MPPTRQQRRAAARRSSATLITGRRLWTLAGAGVAVLGLWIAWSALGRRLPARDGAPAWSPDGSHIAFYSEQNGAADLFVMRVDGSDRRRLTETKADEGAPAYAPDGGRIAFDSDADGNFEIYVMQVDGSSRTRLTQDAARDVSRRGRPTAGRSSSCPTARRVRSSTCS
jgi:Tol biopolymer transport system component